MYGTTNTYVIRRISRCKPIIFAVILLSATASSDVPVGQGLRLKDSFLHVLTLCSSYGGKMKPTAWDVG